MIKNSIYMNWIYVYIYRLFNQIVDLCIYYPEFRTRVDLALIRQIQR